MNSWHFSSNLMNFRANIVDYRKIILVVFLLRTNLENLADHKWSADRTLGNTDLDDVFRFCKKVNISKLLTIDYCKALILFTIRVILTLLRLPCKCTFRFRVSIRWPILRRKRLRSDKCICRIPASDRWHNHPRIWLPSPKNIALLISVGQLLRTGFIWPTIRVNAS